MVVQNADECAYLVLGCYGRTENGFVLCPSVQNRILQLDERLVNFDNIIEYLDIVNLFDRPLLDQNAVRHLIYNLQDRYDQKIKRLWNDHQYHLLERFMHMHKPCGFYAQVILVPSFEKNPPEEEEEEVISFLVSGTPERQPIASKTNLNTVRSRKY